MKKATFLLLMILSLNGFTQKEKDLYFFHSPTKSKTISKIDIVTGQVLFTVKLSEPPYYYKLNNEKTVVYAATRHFAYKIDSKTGEIIKEFQFTDILTKEEGEVTDPNINIIPLGLSNEGIGFFQNIQEDARELKLAYDKLSKPSIEQFQTFMKEFSMALHESKIRTYNIEKETSTIYRKISDPLYGTGASPKIINNELIFYKTLKDNSQIIIEFYDLHTPTLIKEITVPIILNGANEYNITKDMISSISSPTIKENNIISITLTPKKDYLNVSYSYLYDTKENKVVDIKKTKVFGKNSNNRIALINCEKNFQSDLKCPEKAPFPSAPEIYTPKKHNKKARAEADKINAERLKEYQKQCKIFTSNISDNSGCKLQIFEMINNEKNLVKEITGTKNASIYYDRYVLYSDGLDYIMYDIEKKAEIWTLGL
jgi:hypothetical protein